MVETYRVPVIGETLSILEGKIQTHAIILLCWCGKRELSLNKFLPWLFCDKLVDQYTCTCTRVDKC